MWDFQPGMSQKPSNIWSINFVNKPAGPQNWSEMVDPFFPSLYYDFLCVVKLHYPFRIHAIYH